jgi:hypothetical protein
MQSKAATVAEYLAELPSDRRTALLEVRDVLLANLDRGCEEGMSYGMICYCVPHRVYPAGYHCDPKQALPYAALASQKNYMSLYVMTVYSEDGTDDAKWFRAAWAKTGKKLDMGKCCIRFRRVEDLALDVIAEALRRMPMQRHIELYEASRAAMAARPRGKPKPAKKVAKVRQGKPGKRVAPGGKGKRAR